MGPLRWPIVDEAGRLGEIVVDDATATVEPCKAGLNNSLLAFLLGRVCIRRDERLSTSNTPEAYPYQRLQRPECLGGFPPVEVTDAPT
jgi:hypothetical protein